MKESACVQDSGIPPKIVLKNELQFRACEDHDSGFVLEDSLRNKYFRIGVEEYHLILCIQSQSHLTKAWKAYKEERNDSVSCLTEQKCFSLIQWLVANDLTEVPSKPDRPKRGVKKVVLNPFFSKISVLDPDHFLSRTAKYLRYVFCWQTHAAFAILAVWAGWILIDRWSEFETSLSMLFTPHRAFSLIVVWLILKAIHEIGHGTVCKQYGGHVRDAGIALILLTPLAYIDVTSSWRFTSRLKRIHVAMAGILVELKVAVLAVFCWSMTDSPTVQQAAADVILMASASTILFNLNPLMRFDGYFVLADLLRIENLSQLGHSYSKYWLQKYLIGFSVKAPRLPQRKRRIIKVYGMAAACWRVLVVFGLIAGAAAIFHGAGIVLAVFGVVSWLMLPTYKFLSGVLSHDDRRTESERKTQICQVLIRIPLLTASVVALLFVIPTELTRTAPGVVEFDPPTILRARSDAFVDRIFVKDGQVVTKGDLVATLRSDTLLSQLSELSARLEQAEQRVRSGQWHHEASELELARKQLVGTRQQLHEVQQKFTALELRAPVDGRVIARRIEELEGQYVKEGREIATLGVERSKRLMLSLAQRDVDELDRSNNSTVSVWTLDRYVMRSVIDRISPRATRDLPAAALAVTSGGDLVVEQTEEGRLTLTEPRFQAYVVLDADQSEQLWSGQKCWISIGAANTSVGQWIYSRIRDYM